MSTDIIRFEALDGGLFKEHFSTKALKLFFAICIPLMLVTFVTWYIIYLWTKKRQAIMQQVHKFGWGIEKV